PCEPIRSTSEGVFPANRIIRFAASANSIATSTLSLARSSSRAVRGSEFLKRKVLKPGGYGNVSNARCLKCERVPDPATSMSTASIPSADVPDIKPTTSFFFRLWTFSIILDQTQDHETRRFED